jgi:hypothetical protein
MSSKTILLASALLGAAWVFPASATTLVSSLAAFQTGATGVITSTPNPGNYDLGQLFLPTTSTIALGDGTSVGLSTAAQVTASQNGFPYLLADGFAGEIFVPQDASGNQVSRVTITLGGGISAFGFEVAPFSSATAAPNFGVAGGPYSVTVTLATGQSSTVQLGGGNDNTGTTVSQFFGFYGGGVSSLTISTSDTNGLGFGNFVDVPEPGAATVLLIGLVGLAGIRRWAAVG